MYCIYAHINKKNNKAYVGLTKNGHNPQLRWDYGSGYNKGTKFYMALKKYGWTNFKHIILESDIPTLEEAKSKEQKWIKEYDSFNNGYNMTMGGDSGSPFQKSRNGKKVICLETKEVFESIRKCAKKIGKTSNDLRRVIMKTPWQKVKGNHYALYDDYLNNSIAKKPKQGIEVMCIETGIVYENSRVAENLLKLTKDSVYKCCRGVRVSSGHYHWQFVDEELRKKHPIKKSVRDSKEVFCPELNKIFFDIQTASFQTGIKAKKIRRCCKLEKKYIIFQNKIYHFNYL